MAFLWIIFLLSRFSHFVQTDCRFQEDTVTCSGVDYIPRIPPNITQLNLFNSHFAALTQDTFINVTNPDNIKHMELGLCKIESIDCHTFDLFVDLTFLGLSFNNLSSNDLKFLLPELADKLNLITLDMSAVGGISSMDEIFSLLHSAPSANLYLYCNHIEQLSNSVLQRLHNIKGLYLDMNYIKEIQFANMTSLEELSIVNNFEIGIPTFCSGEASLTPNLKYLRFGDNNMSVLHKDCFKCLPNLLEVRIKDGFKLMYIESDVFYYTPKISYFDFKRYYLNSNLLNIKPYAFRSRSLSTLRLIEVVPLFYSTFGTFKGLPNLTVFEMINIDLNNMTEEKQSELFSPLTALINFTCQSCGLRGNTSSFLGNMPHLQNIYLNNNYIRVLSFGTYMHNLQTLHLHGNKISQVSQEEFSEEVLNRLLLLDVSHNPFVCDCNSAWFFDWLKRVNNSKLVNFPSQYVCTSPLQLVGKFLIDVDYSYSDCHHFSTAEWVGVIAGPLLGIILLLSVVIYRNRWNIKHYIYLLRKRRNYVQIEGRNYEYDAFVAYSQDNYKWVVNFLLPLLEGEFHLKVCVHDRDFRAGAFINDNIVRCMDNSRRIILVLSNAFANSGWCMFELKIANSINIEKDVEVVVVVLEEILAGNMNRSLKLLLETTTYLEWTDQNDVGHELFLTRLKDAMRV